MRNPLANHSSASLIVAVAIIGACLILSPTAPVNTASDVLLAGDQRALTTYERAKEALTTGVAVAIIVSMDDVFTSDGIDTIEGLSGTISSIDGVRELRSLTRLKRPFRNGMSLGFAPFTPPADQIASLTDKEWASYRATATAHPLTRNVLVSADSRHAMILVVFDRTVESRSLRDRLASDLTEAVRPFRSEAVEVELLSFPLIEREVARSISRDAALYAVAALAICLLVLIATQRSIRILMAVLLSEGVVLGLLPSLIWLNGVIASGLSHTLSLERPLLSTIGTLSPYAVVLFPLTGAVHLTFMVHFLSSWRRARPRYARDSDAFKPAFENVFKPSLVAATTTGVGLLSLATCEIGVVREFGILGAQAIALSFVIAFGPFVALLKLLHHHKIPLVEPARETDGVWERIGYWAFAIRSTKGVCVAIALVLFAVAIPGLLRLRTDARAIEFLDTDSPSRGAAERVDQRLGGVNLFELRVTATDGGDLRAPGKLAFMDSVRRHAQGVEGVEAVYDYSQILALMNHIWNGEAEGSYALPDNPLTLGLFMTLVETQGFPFLKYVRSDDYRAASILIRTASMPASDYLALLEDIVCHAERQTPAGVEVKGQKGLHTVLEADRRIVRSQLKSLAVAAVAMFVSLLVFWRSPRYALLALLSAMVPLVVVLGIAGYCGVALNSITIMAASVALGVSVDDAAHLLTYYRRLRRTRGNGVGGAMRHSLEAKGIPIVTTSVILVLLLSLFAFSSFPPIVHFGALAAGSLLLALASVLLLLPAMVFNVEEWRRRTQENNAPQSESD